MGIIVPSAHVELCKSCRMHARIIFGDKSESQDFSSLEEGLTHARTALADGQLTNFEFDLIHEQLIEAEEEICRQIRVLISSMHPEEFEDFRQFVENEFVDAEKGTSCRGPDSSVLSYHTYSPIIQ